MRLAFGVAAWVALAAAAFFLIRTERDIQSLRSRVRVFDLHAREAADALADLRAAQQAYVAAGQGVAFWMPKVASTIDTVKRAIESLRDAAAGDAARTDLLHAEATVGDFDSADKRAREYITSGDQLMAADVIFSEGGETASSAARDVEQARLSEHQALDAREAAARRQQAIVLGAGAGLVALLVVALVPLPRAPEAEPASAEPARSIAPAPARPVAPPSVAASRTAPILRTAADLCTEFGRIRDLDDLTRMLGRAADVLDASGLVVWIGNTRGGDLHPVASHGYTPQVVARMPAVPRSADNAAAAAYRTGKLQIVLSRPGGAAGALVAPLLAADGCIGALSAEIRGGGEGSDSVQALAAIFASQLASMFATSATAEPAADQPKTAAQA